jgi:hypothetical protein
MACELGMKIDRDFNDAMHERVDAENALTTGTEPANDRGDRFDRAKREWSAMIDKLIDHRRHCAECRGANVV